MTSGFSGAVTERLIHETSERGIHLIIEGTGRTTDVPHRTAELLVKKVIGSNLQSLLPGQNTPFAAHSSASMK